MLMDEVFHDDYGYGHYIDPETDAIIIGEFYKKKIANEIDNMIASVTESTQNQTLGRRHVASKIEAKLIMIHVFYLCTIGYLSYSLLFKKL